MDLREYRDSRRGGTGRHPWELVRPDIVRRLLPASVTPDMAGLILDLRAATHSWRGTLARLSKATFRRGRRVDDESSRHRGQAGPAADRALSYASTKPALVGGGPADVVMLLDVIEHVEDDVAFLRELRQTRLVRRRMGPDYGTAHHQLFSAHDRCSVTIAATIGGCGPIACRRGGYRSGHRPFLRHRVLFARCRSAREQLGTHRRPLSPT